MKKLIEKWNNWLDDIAKDRIIRINKDSVNSLIKAYDNCEVIIGDTHSQMCTELNELKEKYEYLLHSKISEDKEALSIISIGFAKYLEDNRLTEMINGNEIKSVEDYWIKFSKEGGYYSSNLDKILRKAYFV